MEAIVKSNSLLLKNMDGTIRDFAAPVSNSGRLKQRITELLNPFAFEVHVEVINNVDVV